MVNKWNIAKLKKLISIVAYFFSFQILIQCIDAISGILIIRQLSKADYAYFGIASTVAISIINISIGGIGSYLISEGIKLKNQLAGLSKLFAEVEQFIAKKKWIVIAVSLPVIIWLYLKNDLLSYRLLFFLLLIVTDVLLRVKIQLYQSVFNIWEKYNTIQLITLGGSISRIMVVVAFSWYFTTEIAYLGLVFSYAFQLYLLIRQSKKYINVSASDTKEHVPVLQKLYISQLPVNLYSYLDSQLVIFILTFFGNTLLLADVNAAGRLSLIVVAVNAFINNFIVVQFAKLHNRLKFIKLLVFTCVFFMVLYAISILAILTWPQAFIWVIGNQYSNVSQFLYLTVISICIANFSGLIYGVNYSKMWITKNWVVIPFNIILQVLLLKFMPPNNFEQVWYYAMMCAMPTLILNIFFCINGIRKMQNVQL